jgi:hypothetical protein
MRIDDADIAKRLGALLDLYIESQPLHPGALAICSALGQVVGQVVGAAPVEDRVAVFHTVVQHMSDTAGVTVRGRDFSGNDLPIVETHSGQVN